MSRFELINGNTELLATNGSQIQHWDLVGKKLLHVFPSTPDSEMFIYDFVYLPTRNRLIAVYCATSFVSETANTRRCELWETNAYTLVGKFPDEHKDCLRDIELSPNGKLVAISSRDGTVTLWDWERQQLVQRLLVKPGTGHANIVPEVCFHPIQPVLITVCHDNQVAFWSTDTGRQLASINVDPKGVRGYGWLGLLKDATFSPDGKILYVGVGGEIWWIDLTFFDIAIEQMRNERKTSSNATAAVH
jgi:WD40 repeat protein